MAITSDDMIAAIKRRVSIPANQALLSDSDIMAIVDNIVRSRLVPLVMSLQQEYFVTRTTTPLVASQSEYAIPYRAIGRKLREIKLVDEQDNERNLALVSLEDSSVYRNVGDVTGFYYRGDKIHTVPDLGSDIGTRSFAMWWFCPPSQLCAVTDAAQVVSVAGNTVLCSTVPTTVSSASAIDFIQGRSGNALLGYDVVPSSSTTGSVIFTSSDDVPTDLVAGDYIAAAGRSPVINWLPNEAQPLIESLSAKRVLQAIGDFEGAKSMEDDIDAEEKNLRLILEPRIDGEPTVLVNRLGLTRGNRFAQLRGLYGGI